MRKITVTLFLAVFTMFAYSQTIVSTAPENKKGILEEYTGIHCGFCPQGHTIANQIKAANPTNFFIINVHAGGYAVPAAGEPDFRTDFGQALANQSQLYGYPAGTINRHYFGYSQQGSPSGATALSRGSWSNAFNTLKTQPSYVNLATEANIDITSREITVHVESYYTGNSPQSSNFLNVALVQNNTTGPQSGGNMGNNYNHNHRLVHMLTGQWGEEITTTSIGTFVDRTYTYTIPPTYNGVFADMDEFEVVVFMTENHQEIISGNGAAVTTSGTLAQNDANLFEIADVKGNCATTITPKLTLYNAGATALTSLAIDYNVNGGATQTYNWSGSIASLGVSEITLPVTGFTLNNTNTITATITTNDDNSTNNTSVTTFGQYDFMPEVQNNVTIFIDTDNWGYELTWKLYNSAGTVVQSGGGTGSNGSAGSYGNNITVNEYYTLPSDCYRLEVSDAYSDGGNAVVIRNANNDNITYVAGSYGAFGEVSFTVSSTASVNELAFAEVVMYPNPTNGVVTITEAKDLNVAIYSVLGKEVYNSTISSNLETINLATLISGVYLVNLSDGNKTSIKKLIIQ